MFSHVVIWWTRPEIVDAPERLIAGAEEFLRSIPGVNAFHVGRMVPSARPVVDGTYQVGLYLQFADQNAQDAYQTHPRHIEFGAKFSPLWERLVVYDFA